MKKTPYPLTPSQMFVPLIYCVHLVFLFLGKAPVRVKQREEDPLPTHTKSNVCPVNLLCSPGLSVPGRVLRTSKSARRRPPYPLTPNQMFVPLIYCVHLVFLFLGSAPVRVKQREEDLLTHSHQIKCLSR